MATTFWNRNIPEEAHQKMRELTSEGQEIMWVAFPPGGDNSWSIITDKTFFNRHIPNECHQKMGEFLAAGHKLRCVAFPPAGGNSWSIITDKTFFNRHIPDECHQKMGEFLTAGHKLRCVAFPPAGSNSWSVITDRTFFNRNVPPECHSRMKDFLGRGQKPQIVAFPHTGGNRWSVLTDKAFYNRGVPDECHMILGEMYAYHGPVRTVAYAPGSNNWSLVSAAKPVLVYRLPFDYDTDWALWNGNWDDPVAGHGLGDPNGAQAYAFDFVHDANHDGVGEEGQNIRAMRAGTVVFADGTQTQNTWGLQEGDPGFGAPGGGNCVTIAHGDGTFSAYCHLQHSKVFVKKGEHVQRGQVIAFVGNTGHSSTAHVHVSVHAEFTEPNTVGKIVKAYFEAKNHICWIPRTGDALLSNNA